MTARTDRQETFLPLRDKTLNNVLRQLLVTEFGYEHKAKFAEAIVDRVLEVVEAFVRPAALVKPGQLLWMAVTNDGHKHARQTMKEIPQTPVVLDLVTEEELSSLAKGETYETVRRQRVVRLLQQAAAQGGVLAQSDLAAMLLLARSRIGRDIASFQENTEQLLPYRGTVQDVGGTLTHKVEAIRLLEAGYVETEICRRLSIEHDLRSVENYVQTYKNVMKLLERGFAPREISGILRVGERLVNAYVEIVREHHPDILKNNPYFQEEAVASSSTPSRGQKSQT